MGNNNGRGVHKDRDINSKDRDKDREIKCTLHYADFDPALANNSWKGLESCSKISKHIL